MSVLINLLLCSIPFKLLQWLRYQNQTEVFLLSIMNESGHTKNSYITTITVRGYVHICKYTW